MLWSHVNSHVMDLTRSGQFQIITDPTCPKVDLVISHLTYLINLPTFRSTFWINFSNQPFKLTYAISLFITSAASLVCGTSLPPIIRTWDSILTYWGMYDSGSWPACRSLTCWGVKQIILEYPLVAVWMKALLNAARTSPLCKCQLGFQESQNDENDEGLGNRPVAPRPDEYVRLDLTWSDAQTFASARLES